jgi:8-oxo-dGTP pyrophosphatase MutT (NUDIX family)
MIRKWPTLEYTKKLNSIVFNYFQAKRSNPDGTKEGNFDVLECRNWVNVLAFDENEQLILVKQYRHGIDEITLEGPAGVVDKNEDPSETAKRELLEETGYKSEDWTFLGKVSANPAFLNNYCSVYLARNCKKVQDQNLDNFEEIEILYKSKDEIRDLIEKGEIHHSLFLSALGLYFLKNFSF